MYYKPVIVTRAQWGARASKPYNVAMGKINYLIVHHTDTANNETGSAAISRVRSIQNYHMDTQGWEDIGYNFLIDAGGKIYEGHTMATEGGHTTGYNGQSIGISMMGNFASNYITSAQETSLVELLAWLKQLNGITLGSIKGHRDLNSTTCPGSVLYSNLQSIRVKVNNLVNQPQS